MTRYDSIGVGYARARSTDPRIAARINAALGGAQSVLNVGCGTGNYEPRDRFVVGIDPSRVMLGQRPGAAAPALQGAAEALPFPDDTFDAALAVLTVHHWHDLEAGVSEMRRTASRQVVFYFEPSFADAVWLVTDYFPEVLDLPTEQAAPGGARLGELFDAEPGMVVPVTADCTDGFAGCYWNRPEAYLEPAVYSGMSCLAQLDPKARDAGLARLRADLASGAWDERHGALREMAETDLGYRLMVAGLP